MWLAVSDLSASNDWVTIGGLSDIWLLAAGSVDPLGKCLLVQGSVHLVEVVGAAVDRSLGGIVNQDLLIDFNGGARSVMSATLAVEADSNWLLAA